MKRTVYEKVLKRFQYDFINKGNADHFHKLSVNDLHLGVS